VVNAYNPSYSGGRDQEDHGWRPAWTKCSQDSISINDRVQSCAPVSPGTQEVYIIGLWSTLTIQIITKAQRAGGMAQVEECQLPGPGFKLCNVKKEEEEGKKMITMKIKSYTTYQNLE
jgi:hypothetical protein